MKYALVLLLPLWLGCARSESAVPIEFGKDHCAYSNDPITDIRFGGEVQLRDGSVHKFMSIECLAGFLLANGVDTDDMAGLWVVDFHLSRQLVPVDQVRFIHTQLRSSPNGLGFLAVGDLRVLDNVHFAYGGEIIEWSDVLSRVAQAWSLQ